MSAATIDAFSSPRKRSSRSRCCSCRLSWLSAARGIGIGRRHARARGVPGPGPRARPVAQAWIARRRSVRVRSGPAHSRGSARRAASAAPRPSREGSRARPASRRSPRRRSAEAEAATPAASPRLRAPRSAAASGRAARSAARRGRRRAGGMRSRSARPRRRRRRRGQPPAAVAPRRARPPLGSATQQALAVSTTACHNSSWTRSRRPRSTHHVDSKSQQGKLVRSSRRVCLGNSANHFAKESYLRHCCRGSDAGWDVGPPPTGEPGPTGLAACARVGRTGAPCGGAWRPASRRGGWRVARLADSKARQPQQTRRGTPAGWLAASAPAVLAFLRRFGPTQNNGIAGRKPTPQARQHHGRRVGGRAPCLRFAARRPPPAPPTDPAAAARCLAYAARHAHACAAGSPAHGTPRRSD